MLDKIELIKHNIQEIKDQHNMIEDTCNEIMRSLEKRMKPRQATPGNIVDAFGSFDYDEAGGGRIKIKGNWRNENIVELVVNGVKIWCHRYCAAQFAGAFADVIAEGLWALVDISQGGGCFVPRHKNWNINQGLSLHSYGIALDFNPKKYPYGSDKRIDQRIVDIFNKWGFVSGSDWQTPDSMHLEWAFFPI